MKKNNMHKRIFTAAIAFLIIASMISGTVITVFADEIKIVTLGADLNEDQRTLMLNYFNVDEGEVEIVEVNNEDEHSYLDGIATQQQIGSHTYSCTYIEPTHEGGIHIKTVNLNWVTCEMIRNALVTSGITNCNVVCAAPKEVSGTGALTGIFKAYETVTEEKLDDEKIELASQELIGTMKLSEVIGQDEATSLMSDLKEEVIIEGITSAEEVTETVNTYLSDNKVELTDDQKDLLIQLMLDISKQDYSVEDVKNAYKDITEAVNNVKKTTEETMGILEKIANWFQTTWQKITGTYETVVKTEEAKAVTEKLGILAQTNDSLLGKDTVVTATEEQSLTADNSKAEDSKAEDSTAEDSTAEDSTAEDSKASDTEKELSIFDKISNFLKEFFGGKTDTQNKAEDSTESSKDTSENEDESKDKTDTSKEDDKDNKLTFDNVNNEDSKDTTADTTADTPTPENTEEPILNEVNWEMQNGSAEGGSQTLDELTDKK